MDIAKISQYVELKGKRIELEKKVKPLRALEVELARAKSAEDEALSAINPDSLITQKSVKVINQFLSSVVLLETANVTYPLSYAHLSLQSGTLTLDTIASHPLSLDTPEKPSENHIPQYRSVFHHVLPVVCWEQDGSELRMWRDAGHKIVFHQGE